MDGGLRWRLLGTRMALLVVLGCMVAACGDGGNGEALTGDTPALIVDRALDVGQTNDFLRMIFLPASVEPTTLGAPGAVRVFVGASAYFIPALAVAEVAAFFGGQEVADQDLIGMRCQPDNVAALDALLASWPQVFAIIRSDLGGQYSCPPPPDAPPENAVYCLALAYVDQADSLVARPLATALEFGAELLEDPASATVVRSRYGIHLAFSGLGLTVKGSGAGQPSTAAEILQASVSPEYLVHNATLGAGGCRCIRVAPYAGRGMDPFDPELIRREGDLGRCRSLPRLRFGS